MSFLTELYNAYNMSLESGLVDKHEASQTVLLPIYHNNMRSNGKNIIQIHLNKDSSLERVEFVPVGDYIVFPVTEDSVARSGSNPPPHPLVDKMDYVVPSKDVKHDNYKKAFLEWVNFLPDGQNKKYLEIIKEFILQKDMLSKILNKLFEDNSFSIDGFNIEYNDSSEHKTVVRKLDLTKVFLTYSINEFDGPLNVGVTENTELHRSYIDYINTNLKPNGVCDITGEFTYISSKHRGLLGNAKLVSVSNNKETYRGRFREKSDVFNIGYQTSEKIHLMLKYLLENKNSSKWLGEQQYLINWVSTDISNENEIDVFKPFDMLLLDSEIETQDDYMPVSIRNKKVGDSFISGKINFSEEAEYYAAIIDKSSNGRLSIKYFRKMPTSQLINNLERWQTNNSWEIYDVEKKQNINRAPSIPEAVMATYGLERDGKFVLDNGNFRKDLFQKLVTCIIDGLPVPKNYLVKLDINIRKRLTYRKKWNSIMYIACGLMNNERNEEFNIMVDKKNTNRSYLFGRLLALYEIIESRTFEQETQRVTNAEKFWSSYTNNPENIMQVLEEKVKPYEQKLSISNPGINVKIQKEKREIITMLDEYTKESDVNKRLTYQFIYGYYSETKFIYSKKEEEVVNA